MKQPFEKSTEELSSILGKAKKEAALEEYLRSLSEADDEMVLCNYLNDILAQKNRALSEVVKESNLSRDYVYNIFNGNRRNPEKMKLIGICLGCHMTLRETQRALEIAQKGVLYPRNPADAIIIYNINNGNWSVMEINQQLYEHGFEIIQ
ncbi:MAG: hypothetical protein IKX54_04755 [Lachnospiraceae bacterium]|nr:hypothetical protein [Lachnospiraceae bacterium]